MENQGAGGGGEEVPGKMNPKRGGGGGGRVPEEDSKNKPKLVSEGRGLADQGVACGCQSGRWAACLGGMGD